MGKTKGCQWNNSLARVGEIFEYWPVDTGYIVSNQGRIFSLKRRAPHMMRPSTNRTGYLEMHYKKHTPFVHGIVALTFLGPKPEGMHTYHIDGNKLNNYLINLKYATAVENEQDKRLHGRLRTGQDKENALLTNEEARQIRVKYLSGFYTQKELAMKYKISGAAISYVIRNETYTDENYIYVASFQDSLKKNFEGCGWF